MLYSSEIHSLFPTEAPPPPSVHRLMGTMAAFGRAAAALAVVLIAAPATAQTNESYVPGPRICTATST